MTIAPAATETDAFDLLDRTLADEGPGAALDRLAATLADRGEFRALLDALLMKARHDLGLPLIQAGGLSGLPEAVRTQYEDRYVEALRDVGRRLLDAGEIAAAWPYFRAIGEKGPVVEAIEAYQPPPEPDERLGQVIDVAFNQGAHPAKGYALILDHYGACSAITAFEHLPPEEATRVACADRLVRHLHAQLVASLRDEIARGGEVVPPEGTSIPDLMAGRPGLFADDAYHLDVSHLAATVRTAPMLEDPTTIGLAAELAAYGRNLSDRHKYEGEPPFDQIYEDHGVYLDALIGREVAGALAHFRAKLPAPELEPRPEESLPAQVLVRLLARLGRLDEAIDVAAEHLRGVPESALFCPSLAQLCHRANRPDRLAPLARAGGDLVNYAAAILRVDKGGVKLDAGEREASTP